MTTAEQRRAQTRERVRRHRVRHGRAIDTLDARDWAQLPEPPSREVLLRALGVQARAGNVGAIKLLLEEYRRDKSIEPAEPSSSVIADLAARRSQRGGAA